MYKKISVAKSPKMLSLIKCNHFQSQEFQLFSTFNTQILMMITSFIP